MPVKKDISMADLMCRHPETIAAVSRGQVIEGQIVALEEGGALVDLGVKSEGVLPLAEIDDISFLAVGTKVSVFVLTTGDKQGRMLVSAKKARVVNAWKLLRESLEKSKAITAEITGFNKGGMVVDILGLQAFLPYSQLISAPDSNLPGPKLQSMLDRMRGTTVQIRVLELDSKQNRIIVSEKAGRVAERKKRESEVLRKVKTGQILDVIVKKVLPFGLLVSYREIDALIPKGELSWEKETIDLSQFTPGQKLTAKVLSVPEKLEGRAKLSMKALKEDPWVVLASEFEKGNLLTGEVVKLTSAGMVVSLPQGLEWSVPLSELAGHRDLRAGDKLELEIKSLDAQNKRLELGIMKANSE